MTQTTDDTSTDQRETVTETAYHAGESAAHNRWVLLIVGGITAIAGIAALAMPLVASLTAALLAAWVLIISGVAGLITAFRRQEGWALAATFVLSIVSLLAGVMMLVEPVLGVFALGTVVIAYFIVAGVLRLYFGARAMGEGGGWMIATGALALGLGVLLWFDLPFSAAWVPGVMLGVDLLFWGALQIALASRIGRSAP